MYQVNNETKRFVHREVYQMKFGKIPKDYHVHHIDKNPSNNEIDNLIAIPSEFHMELHEIDRMGFKLRNKREVEVALTFYLRGKAMAKTRNVPKPEKISKNIIKTKPRKKSSFRSHPGSIIRRY